MLVYYDPSTQNDNSTLANALNANSFDVLSREDTDIDNQSTNVVMDDTTLPFTLSNSPNCKLSIWLRNEMPNIRNMINKLQYGDIIVINFNNCKSLWKVIDINIDTAFVFGQKVITTSQDNFELINIKARLDLLCLSWRKYRSVG